ncbi:hypothetical protein TRIUR3_33975 [Triticum urartu]|uniref:Cytokinin riboside 5'-monophosphate phosphoribohydrolase n=1 Tax=Triticum urartu TaxID=4572 RepID=M7YH02_TRIUA|nr:hypothetical protein TRIUR3_33975 [Triticum urartu]
MEAPTSTTAALVMPKTAPASDKKLPSRFRRVCVFCGSSAGRKAAYQAAAVQLGQQLVERGIDLVYGGGSVGLMGLVSRAVHGGGGRVTGVVPRSVLPRELIGETPGGGEVPRRADAFVALPGGYGTLEELLEVITWAQLGIHDKPVGLLNVDGYYDSLLAFIDRAVEEGFVAPAARKIIVAAPTPGELLAALEEYVPAHHDASSVKLSWESSVDTRTCSPSKPDISR